MVKYLITNNIIFHQCKCKLHSDYKTHPHFSPKFGGGGVSYSPKKYGTQRAPPNSYWVSLGPIAVP